MIGKKILIVLLTAGILCNHSAVNSAANPFCDVPAGHWAYIHVTLLTSRGIFNGYGDGTFRGNRNITRYETATILAKLLSNKKANASYDESLKFTDVTIKHWAYRYVNFVAQNGISKGYDDNTFRGDKYITRYEMTQMLANVLELNKAAKKISNPFSDVASSHWATDAVINLASEGIIEGYGDGTFRGNKNITRYEAATMVARVESMLK